MPRHPSEAELVRKARTKGIDLSFQWDSGGGYSGLHFEYLVAFLKFAAAAVTGAALGALGKDLWRMLKRRITKGASAETVAHMFLVLQDPETTIFVKVVAGGRDMKAAQEGVHAVVATLQRLTHYREIGVFRGDPMRLRDGPIRMIALTFDSGLHMPILCFFAKDEPLPECGPLLTTLFPDISGDSAAESYRYLGWRVLHARILATRTKDARQEFSTAIKLFGYEEPEACHGIAESYYDERDYVAALSWYRRVKGREADNPSVIINQGCCAASTGDLRAAEMLFKRAVQLHPNQPKSFYNLACVHAELGRKQQALDALEKAVKLGFDEIDSLDRDFAGWSNIKRFRTIRSKMVRSAKK